jgi:hypothetical protein
VLNLNAPILFDEEKRMFIEEEFLDQQDLVLGDPFIFQDFRLITRCLSHSLSLLDVEEFQNLQKPLSLKTLLQVTTFLKVISIFLSWLLMVFSI